MTDKELTGALPEAIATRIVSAKAKDGVATLVLDVAGLDERARGELEQAVKGSRRHAARSYRRAGGDDC